MQVARTKGGADILIWPTKPIRHFKYILKRQNDILNCLTDILKRVTDIILTFWECLLTGGNCRQDILKLSTDIILTFWDRPQTWHWLTIHAFCGRFFLDLRQSTCFCGNLQGLLFSICGNLRGTLLCFCGNLRGLRSPVSAAIYVGRRVPSIAIYTGLVVALLRQSLVGPALLSRQSTSNVSW